jgi:uncharacterized membrane protein YkvA (DUF1232 family)
MGRGRPWDLDIAGSENAVREVPAVRDREPAVSRAMYDQCGNPRSLPRGLRVRLWLLFAYLAFPIDLVPDFIPVIGYVDDAVIVAAVLRSVVRRAGREAIARHWPGTEDGLAALWRVASLPVA